MLVLDIAALHQFLARFGSFCYPKVTSNYGTLANGDASQDGSVARLGKFDVILLDPPYDTELLKYIIDYAYSKGAILVAAAVLLLAGCAIIYRNEIRDFITDIREHFVKVSFSEGENESQNIEEIYELTYLPEGYTLESQHIGKMIVQYVFTNSKENHIRFIQQPLDSSSFAVDIEHGDYEIINIGEYEVYYRQINTGYYYIWNDGKYALKINSTELLPEQLLKLIIEGIQIK